MTVHWTESALTDVAAAEAQAARHSPRYARALVARIFDKVALLADQPRLGAEVPEYADENIRELFEHPYRIVYKVGGDRVEVSAVVHASRRMPRSV